MLFISSDSIPKIVGVCFCGVLHDNSSRDMLQNGASQRCTCVKLSTNGGIASFWGAACLPKKVSRDTGYRSDSIAISWIWGH